MSKIWVVLSIAKIDTRRHWAKPLWPLKVNLHPQKTASSLHPFLPILTTNLSLFFFFSYLTLNENNVYVLRTFLSLHRSSQILYLLNLLSFLFEERCRAHIFRISTENFCFFFSPRSLPPHKNNVIFSPFFICFSSFCLRILFCLIFWLLYRKFTVAGIFSTYPFVWTAFLSLTFSPLGRNKFVSIIF